MVSAPDEIGPGDIGLSFLPLAHVYERAIDYGYIFRGIPVAYVERIEEVAQALLEVRPTIVAAVPRFFEKMYANIFEKARRETGVKAPHFRMGDARGQSRDAVARLRALVSPWTKLQWEVANSAGVFENSRGTWRPREDILFRRRATCGGVRRILRGDRRADFSGLRAHRDFAGGLRECAQGESKSARSAGRFPTSR